MKESIKNKKESEDERIRKAIIHYILYETKGTISEATEHTWVKWLEKQKPAEWSEEDEVLRVRTINRLETLNYHGITGKEIRESIDWLKRLRSQPKKGLHPGSIRKVDNPMKWMEEDEKEREQKPVT